MIGGRNADMGSSGRDEAVYKSWLHHCPGDVPGRMGSNRVCAGAGKACMSDQSLNLKPCPFCGSPGELCEDEGKTTSKHYTADCACSNCTYVRSPTGWGITKEEAKQKAIAAWNERIS